MNKKSLFTALFTLMGVFTFELSYASNRAIMEGISASSNTIYIDTTSVRVDIGTITYTGGIGGVSLFSSSNVVVSSGTGLSNYIVLYATGSIIAQSFFGSGANLTGLGTSTGSVTTAALTGNGQSSSPLGVSFSSVPSLGQNNTFTGSNSFSSDVTFSSITIQGDSSAASNNGRNYVQEQWMKSFDGATESSGCYVVYTVGDPSAPVDTNPATMVFTSTTTGAVVAGARGVLMETCAPLSICRVAVLGVVRVLVNGVQTIGNPLDTSTTRCQGVTGSVTNSNGGALLSGGSGAGTMAWFRVGGR